jgi:hypothetical protein
MMITELVLAAVESSDDANSGEREKQTFDKYNGNNSISAHFVFSFFLKIFFSSTHKTIM